MPRWLRIVIYSVLLVLALYMYWNSGQVPPSQIPPTARPQPTLHDPLRASGSLNVRRDALTDAFSGIPYNLRFDFVPLADGRSRVVGRSADGRTTLELIGPPEEITAVNLMAALPEDRPLTRLKNLNAISLLVESTLSDWPDAAIWVSANIDSAFSGKSATTQASGKTLSMSVAPSTDTLVVTITGPPL